MKKALGGLLAAGMLCMAVAAFADKGMPVFKKGETVYVCACGEGCDCKTMSRREGTCKCGKALGKGVISSIGADKAVVDMAGKQVDFPTKAAYVCSCGEACKCGTVSQQPGTCGCGKPLKKL